MALINTSVDIDAMVNSGGTNGLSQAELDASLRALGKMSKMNSTILNCGRYSHWVLIMHSDRN